MSRELSPDVERIVAVAGLLRHVPSSYVDTYQVYAVCLPPARHDDIIHQCPGMVVQQGFVTNLGRFVGRRRAWKIAEAAGQIVSRCGGDTAFGGTLYSENLW
jgi:hypothetical protein